jgi:hypothetical protein
MILARRGAAVRALKHLDPARAVEAATRCEAAVPGAPLVSEACVVAERNRQRFDTVSAEVRRSLAALRQAQINLRYALQSTGVSLEEINGYVAQVEEFVQIYRILRDR